MLRISSFPSRSVLNRRQRLARHEVHAQARRLVDVRQTRGAAAGHAIAGVGQQDGLLRQPARAFQPELQIDQMVRLAGQLAAIEEEIARRLRRRCRTRAPCRPSSTLIFESVKV